MKVTNGSLKGSFILSGPQRHGKSSSNMHGYMLGGTMGMSIL